VLGTFSNSSMIKSFRRLCQAAKAQPIPRVYADAQPSELRLAVFSFDAAVTAPKNMAVQHGSTRAKRRRTA
jgi:hypothetical protein